MCACSVAVFRHVMEAYSYSKTVQNSGTCAFTRTTHSMNLSNNLVFLQGCCVWLL